MRTCTCSAEHDFKLAVFFLSIVSVSGLHRAGPQLTECVIRQTGCLALRCAAVDDTWRDGRFTPLPTHPRHCLQLRSPFTALGFCFCHTIHGTSTDLSVNTGCCGSLLPSYCQWRPPPPPQPPHPAVLHLIVSGGPGLPPHLPTRPCSILLSVAAPASPPPPPHLPTRPCPMFFCYIGHSGFLLHRPLWVSVITLATLGFCYYIGHSAFLLHRPLWVSVTWATLGFCYIGHSGFLLPAPP